MIALQRLRSSSDLWRMRTIGQEESTVYGMLTVRFLDSIDAYKWPVQGKAYRQLNSGFSKIGSPYSIQPRQINHSSSV